MFAKNEVAVDFLLHWDKGGKPHWNVQEEYFRFLKVLIPM